MTTPSPSFRRCATTMSLNSSSGSASPSSTSPTASSKDDTHVTSTTTTSFAPGSPSMSKFTPSRPQRSTSNILISSSRSVSLSSGIGSPTSPSTLHSSSPNLSSSSPSTSSTLHSSASLATTPASPTPLATSPTTSTSTLATSTQDSSAATPSSALSSTLLSTQPTTTQQTSTTPSTEASTAEQHSTEKYDPLSAPPRRPPPPLPKKTEEEEAGTPPTSTTQPEVTATLSDSSGGDTSAASSTPNSSPSPAPTPNPASTLDMSTLGDWVSGVTPEELEKLPEMLTKRRRIAQETLQTEETYTHQVNLIMNKFVTELKSNTRGLALEDTYSIFSNIAVIRDCHERLKKTLTQRMQDWNPNSQLGDIFQKETAWIKLYKHYVNNYGRSLMTLKECKQNHAEFRKYMESIDYTPALSGLNLEGLLIVPVQRIPRYVLLLNDMLKSTPSTHPDHAPLSGALATIKELADFINENKHDADTIAELCNIQAKFVGYSGKLASQAKRKFLRDFSVLINKKKRHLWLFNDVAVITKPETSSGKYSFDVQINLNTSSIQPGPNFSFNLICTEGKFLVGLPTQQEYDDVKKEINLACAAAREMMMASIFVDTQMSGNLEGSRKYASLVTAELDKKLAAALQQLIDTEHEYVKQLNSTHQNFITPMKQALANRTGDQAVDTAIINKLFTTWEQFITQHTKLSADLERRQTEWDTNSTITDLFGPNFLDVYNAYIGSYSAQFSAFEAASNDRPFTIWLLEIEAVNKAELKSCLQRPLSRISEYYLITQEMVLYTNKKSPHLDPLKKLVVTLSVTTEDLKRLTTHLTKGAPPAGKKKKP
ncbi:Guanine exchange factor for Rac 30 [Pelomyxa schiedti]|nr:Guanine exchange factor for Rac 30 [Pelomyxa schiedti]